MHGAAQWLPQVLPCLAAAGTGRVLTWLARCPAPPPATQELQALQALGTPNSRFRAPAPTEDADTWAILAEACVHNRCFTFGMDQYGQLGQGVTTNTSSKGSIRCAGAATAWSPCRLRGVRVPSLTCPGRCCAGRRAV